MADFCKDYDAELHDETLKNGWILCEGHGRLEKLDGDGRVVEFKKITSENNPIMVI